MKAHERRAFRREAVLQRSLCERRKATHPTFSERRHKRVHLCVDPKGENQAHSRWIARKRGPKEGEEPDPKSGEFRLFSRPGEACTVILWMKSATRKHTRQTLEHPPGWQTPTQLWVSLSTLHSYILDCTWGNHL